MVDDLRNDRLLMALRNECPPIDPGDSDPTGPHAQQMLNRILAVPPARNRRSVRPATGGRRTLRARRLMPGVAGAAVVVAGVVVAVGALAPGGHPAGSRTGQTTQGGAPKVRLAAWTVTRQADGNISVTVRELQDPAGLQSTLRADGVPASVTFDQQLNSACRPYPGGTPESSSGTALLEAVFPTPYQHLDAAPPQNHAVHLATGAPNPNTQNSTVILTDPSAVGSGAPSPDAQNSTVIVIDPSALPNGAAVQLAASLSAEAILTPQLVDASAQCTGN